MRTKKRKRVVPGVMNEVMGHTWVTEDGESSVRQMIHMVGQTLFSPKNTQKIKKKIKINKKKKKYYLLQFCLALVGLYSIEQDI